MDRIPSIHERFVHSTNDHFYEMAPLTTSPSVHRMAIYSKIPIHTKLVKFEGMFLDLQCDLVKVRSQCSFERELEKFSEKKTFKKIKEGL